MERTRRQLLDYMARDISTADLDRINILMPNLLREMAREVNTGSVPRIIDRAEVHKGCWCAEVGADGTTHHGYAQDRTFQQSGFNRIVQPCTNHTDNYAHSPSWTEVKVLRTI